MDLMRAGSFAVGFAAVLIIAFAPGYPARSGWPSASAETQVTFTHNAKGLEQEYQALIDAFAAGDSAKARQEFTIFSLPDPAGWFAKYFAKDQVEQLARDNEAELSSYEPVLLRGLGAVPAGTRFRVRCKPPHADPTARMAPRRDAMVPSVPIPVEQFVTEFTPLPKLHYGQFSMLVNYVYVDGAFRYLGKGDYPFWSMPDASPKK